MSREFRYEIDIFWSDSDRAYVAEVPELPGCAADGATYEAAVIAAQDAIRMWIDTARDLGRSVPEPRQHATKR